MNKHFIRLISQSLFILIILLPSCKKDTILSKQEIAVSDNFAASFYRIHSAVKKLDSLSGNLNNYEIAFWLSDGTDSLTALQLTTDINLNSQVSIGGQITVQKVKLKKGSYVTRTFVQLKGPVSVAGKGTTPSTYQGKRMYYDGVTFEKTYQLEPIHVSGKTFKDAVDNNFIPWGVNYTNTNELRLMDDNWNDPVTWEIIKQDFREMKALGVNVIRIHLQYNRFMVNATTPNQQALSRLKDLIIFAGTYGLYLDITGLGCYIKEDVPSWYTMMSEKNRWATQAVFWKAIAGVGKQYNNIFAYNLMNEPVTPSKTTTEWLPGEPYGGYYFVQNITRTPGKRTWQTVTRSWIQTLKNAIRKEDDHTPVTVGFIALGNVAQFNDLLDYNSAHLYPEDGKMNEALNFVNNNQTAKPLVIEETSWFAGFDNMKSFINTTQSQNLTQGYLSHYGGETIDQLKQNGDLGSAIQADWYKLFCFELNPNYNKPLNYNENLLRF
ncbi:MAG: cellulase family glycosylhydrolase [Ginsengibacter sp.]